MANMSITINKSQNTLCIAFDRNKTPPFLKNERWQLSITHPVVEELTVSDGEPLESWHSGETALKALGGELCGGQI